MPLYHGMRNVGRNMEAELAAGRPHDQALAIALHAAGVPRKKKRGKRKRRRA